MLSKADFDNIYSKVPRTCVDIIVENTRNEKLYAKRSIPPYCGWWHFIGGTVFRDESFEKACRRILNEEAGIKERAVLEQLGVWEYSRKEAIGDTHSIIYRCKIINDAEICAGKRTSNVKFFINPPLRTIPPHLRMLKKFG